MKNQKCGIREIIFFIKSKDKGCLDAGIFGKLISSLFSKEISACAAVHMCYVMAVCDQVWYIIL